MNRHLELPKSFADLGLEAPILRALAAIDYKEPTDIQREAIPRILAGHDVLGQARTGTGKTAAFCLPILQKIDPEGRLQALIVTPTRELAAQVVGEVRRYSEHLAIHCVPVYGGVRMKQQLKQLGRKPHIIVGTPGRILDLIRRQAIGFDDIRFVVLDEVDRMLDIGFRDDIKQMLGNIKSAHQTIFVSATIEEEINRLARQFMTDPVEVNVSRDQMTVSEVSQYYCHVGPWDKVRLLRLLLAQEAPKLAIVFCNTKHAARKLAARLHAHGIDARDIHGDLVQEKRERIMARFRKHQIPVLVATDLASRGIDVHEVTHIINYDIPQDPEVYVHRIGRTARMGKSGKAITFVTQEQGKELTEVEMLINQQIAKLEIAGFEPSPPPRETEAAARTAPAPSQPAAADASPEMAEARKPKTLGGKFPVARRFRRR